jgi:rubrerythrin
VKKSPTQLGMNRTGIKASPLHGKALEEGAASTPPMPEGDDGALRAARRRFMEEAAGRGELVGSVPPPVGLKGAAKAAVSALRGSRESVFVDKLGERLAFERTGSRLVQALLLKYDALGSWTEGPSRQKLEDLLSDELAHFDLVRECIEQMGGDPTAITPSADIHAVASQGLLKVVVDPRTDLRQSMEMLLLAELADNAGWELLVPLARELGHTGMAERFEAAHLTEAHHLAMVRGWLERGLGEEAGVDLRE